MIKKIICPTDFSATATNAAGYAAKLAQVLGAELLFVNVQRPLSAPAYISFEEEGETITQTVESRLIEMCAEVHKLFKVVTNYEIDLSASSLETILAKTAGANTMIVMGTNGSDSLYTYLFGSNTFRLLKKANCPVLLVPEKVTYRSIGKIVFAWDYSTGNRISFSELAGLVKLIDPKFIFLHVSTHKPASSNEVFTAERHEIEGLLEKEARVEFEQLFLNNIPDGIGDYMTKSNADLLALTYYNRSLFRALFHGEVAKRFTESANYPILVLHS